LLIVTPNNVKIMSEYIFRTTHTANYTVFSNSLISDENLSAHARIALQYLLSKPKTWKMRISDLKRVIGTGQTKAYKILRELRNAGHAVLRRTQRKSEWFFYEIPIPKNIHTPPTIPVESHSGASYRGGNHHDLVSKDLLVSKEDIPQENKEVVAFVEKEKEKITLPAQLKQKHHKAAYKALSKLNVEQAALVMVILKTALTKKLVKNPIAYLHGLVNSALDNELTAPNNKQTHITTAQKLDKERQLKEQDEKRHKVENAAYFKEIESLKKNRQPLDNVTNSTKINKLFNGIKLRLKA